MHARRLAEVRGGAATNPVENTDAAERCLQATSQQYDGNVRAMIADYNGGVSLKS